MNSQSSDACILWMGNVESYMSEYFLMTAFKIMGENPISIKVLKKGGEPGYAFVKFRSQTEAQSALYRCNHKIIPNSKPSTRFNLNNRHVADTSAREYLASVEDLPTEIDDQKLFKIFADKYRSLRRSKVFLDAHGCSKGYGYLSFSDHSDCVLCCKMMNGYKVNGKPIRLNVTENGRNFYVDPQDLKSSALSEPLQFWTSYSNLNKDLYQIRNEIFDCYSLQIPAFARLYTKSELELIDHSGKLNYNPLNATRSQQDYNLWDPLENSSWSSPNEKYNECCTVPSAL